jgi:hypothetical protein
MASEAVLTNGDVARLIQEVGDAVEVLLDAAVFPDRLFSQDEAADPRHARYLLAMRALSDAFGLELARRAGATQEEEPRMTNEGGGA